MVLNHGAFLIISHTILSLPLRTALELQRAPLALQERRASPLAQLRTPFACTTPTLGTSWAARTIALLLTRLSEAPWLPPPSMARGAAREEWCLTESTTTLTLTTGSGAGLCRLRCTSSTTASTATVASLILETERAATMSTCTTQELHPQSGGKFFRDQHRRASTRAIGTPPPGRTWSSPSQAPP